MTTEDSRFYYLRLMAKPRSEDEPQGAQGMIKPKFVQWGQTTHFNTSVEESPELEVHYYCHSENCSGFIICFSLGIKTK